MRRAMLVTGCLLIVLGVGWWALRDHPESSVVIAETLRQPPIEVAGPEVPIARPEASVPSERVALAVESAGAFPAPESALLIQVVDASGVYVAGIPIGIRKAEEPRGKDILTAMTEGTQGTARFEEPSKRLAPLYPQGRFFVHLAIVGCLDIGETIDLADMPRESLLLRLPPFGSVTVTVQDSEGKPLRPRIVTLEETEGHDDQGEKFVTLSPGERGPRSLRSFAAASRAMSPEIGLGRSRFPCVPLGLDLTLRVTTDEGQSEVRRGSGPRLPGEDVTFDFDMGEPLPVLVGRLIDEQGAPILECNFHYVVDSRTGGAVSIAGSRDRTARSDATGGFRVVVPMRAEPGFNGKLVLAPNCPGWDGKSEARVKLDGSLRPGINELGDVIVVRARSSLATGRVVDDGGAPVPKALVDVFSAETVDGVETWKYCQSIGGRSGEDGSFTIEGLAPGDRFMLRASRRGHSDGQSAVFAANAVDVWIVLTRSARIKGSALLDAAATNEKLWVRATRKSDTQEQRELFRDRERAWIDQFGSFQLDDVRPGECDLSFGLKGEVIPSFVLEGIQLRAGETATDARLESIDLRGRIVRSAPTAVPKRD